MRPRIEAVCQKMAEDLIVRVIPEMGPAYHQGTVGMIASLLGIIAEEWDRAASRRIEENHRLREILGEAASVVKDAPLKHRLLELADARDTDFRISALEAGNCALRAALIELHSHVESLSGADARRVEETIWKELVASTERRRLMSAQF